MTTKRVAYEKFRITLNGGTFDVPIVFEGDSENEASALIIDDIPDFDPITVSRTIEGQSKVAYIRIPVKGGYIVVKIVTIKRRKTFDAEIRKIKARANIGSAHMRYINN